MGQKEILLFQWESVGKDDLVYSFKRLGFEVDVVFAGHSESARKENYREVVSTKLKEKSFGFVFSTNFFYYVALACHDAGVPYISWAYDSPARIDNEDDLGFDTNHLFLFDSKEVAYYQDIKKCNNVQYMPLGVNVYHYDKILSDKKKGQRFASEISFVGRLYDSKIGEAMGCLDEYRSSFLLGLSDAGLKLRDANYIYSVCNKGLIDWINNEKFNEMINGEFEAVPSYDRTPYRLAVLLSKYATNKERVVLLSMLSNHFDVSLFSDTSHNLLKNVKERGTVDYSTEMPFVFNNSKINLNSTYLSIRAGIPLRCIDVMGCHGLLLSNHQKDFDEYFKDGESVLLYDSVEEAYEKCKFYLAHETERKKIENKGYEIVKNYFTYEERLKEIIIKSGLQKLLGV